MLKQFLNSLTPQKARNLSEPDEDTRVATSNKEPHCSMIIEKNNKRAMFNCWCTLL